MKHVITIFLISCPLINWAQLSSGQLVHYPFNGNTQDLSSNSLHATAVNNPVYVADANGTPNSAIELNGVDQRIDLPSSSIIRPTSFPITFSFWFKVSSFASFGNKLFISNFNNSAYHGYYCMVKNNSLELSFGSGTGLASQDRRSFFVNQSFQTNTWYHVVFVVTSSTQATAWINCQSVSVTTSGSGGNVIYGNSPGYIGMGRQNTSTNAPYYHHGAIDEFRMWDRVLSTAEITQLCTPCSDDSTFMADNFCSGDTYLFDGQQLSTPGQYTAQLTNSSGCDSLVTLDLSETSVDTSITQVGPTLFASNLASGWQWINCENGQAIQGETNSSFTPLVNGAYAVIVDQDGCSDTSNCFNVSDISILENAQNQINVYPNPHNGFAKIDLPEGAQTIEWTLFDLTGRKLNNTTQRASEFQAIPLPSVTCLLKVWVNGEYQGYQILLHQE